MRNRHWCAIVAISCAAAAAGELFPPDRPHTPQVDAFVEAGHHSALTSAEYPNACWPFRRSVFSFHLTDSKI
eukprot:SAG11_NODE_1300_length_5261_cov_8.900232_7_plen_72_part_00